MHESLALELMTVGGAIAVISPIGGYVALFRLLRAQRRLAGNRTKVLVASFEYMYWVLLFAMITAGGLVLLVLGGVVGYGVAAWAPALPGGLLIGSALVAAYVRWQLVRLRT